MPFFSKPWNFNPGDGVAAKRHKKHKSFESIISALSPSPRLRGEGRGEGFQCEARKRRKQIWVSFVLLVFSVAISSPAQVSRHGVASLAPNLTELVYALGFGTQLVARSSACDFPPEAKSLPIAGEFGRPNLEALERIRPAFVLVTDVENTSILPSIDQAGARCLKLSCEGWSNLLAAADTIGIALGDAERATAWKLAMKSHRSNIAARVDAAWRDRIRPRVFAEIWSDPPTTAGRGSFLDDLISLAGGINIAREQTPSYAHVAPEWVVRENPDAIVLLYMMQTGRDAAASVRNRTGWGGMTAIKRGAICTNVPPDLLLRSGPRCLDGVEMLADWLQRL